MPSLILIALAGLLAQLVDGGLGMGFGVVSTSFLISFAGLAPAAASASVHVAELGTTFVSGLSHWRFGNVKWGIVLWLAVPGAVGAFAGATFLSNISTEAATPIMGLILTGIGLFLMARFVRGWAPAPTKNAHHNRGFLGVLGVFGGFIDSTGGGGWGPTTTSTLLAVGKDEPRKVIGTVSASEFLVTLAAVLGFVYGLRQEILEYGTSILALLAGGVIAAPLAAFIVTKINPAALGGVVGTLLIVLNLPDVLEAAGVGDTANNVVRVIVIVVGLGSTLAGYLYNRKQNQDKEQQGSAGDSEQSPAGAKSESESAEAKR